MNKKILRLALPNIITNITVPLLGIVDTAIVGHLSSSHLGAIAIGTSIFNLIYWNFGFLRMGTSGFTAQAYGARRDDETVRVLLRAIIIAILIAILLISLQYPISLLARILFNGSPIVIQLAISYFFIRIWAAPATLGLYAIKGWFIGMQNSIMPMLVAIIINVVNIVCSLIFVLVLHWDIKGVALGTVVAQYSGLLLSILLLAVKYRGLLRSHISKHLVIETLKWNEMRLFFKVNGDIFLRTVCLATVFTFITSASGRISDQILAADTLILQFFTLFSYFIDGFAYAGESLVGRFIGAKDRPSLQSCVRHLLTWGFALTILFTALYAFWADNLLSLFSDKTEVIEASRPFLFWVLIIPLCGFSAFLFDGIFVGATASKEMRNTMLIATAVFFLTYYSLLYLTGAKTSTFLWNNILWTSFVIWLTLRGTTLAIMLPKAVFKKATSNT